jgi:hypothetical protein
MHESNNFPDLQYPVKCIPKLPNQTWVLKKKNVKEILFFRVAKFKKQPILGSDVLALGSICSLFSNFVLSIFFKC